MFKTNVGGNYNFKFNDKIYELEDPKEFLLDLFTYPEYPETHVDMVVISLIGSMGGGKSCVIDNIVNLLYSIYEDELNAFRTNDLVYALNQVSLGFVQLIILDDAMCSDGTDSRRSMSTDNVNMSQNFSIGRHIAEKRMGAGILFIIFAIQSPTRLDKFIRENTDVTMYKTYYPELLKKKIEIDDVQFVKDFTEEAMLKHKFKARGSALGITRTDKTIRFYFPLTKPMIEIPFIKKESDDYEDLLIELQNFDLEEVKRSVLKGFIFEYCENNKLSISQSMVSNLINKAFYLQWKGDDNSKSMTISETDKKVAFELYNHKIAVPMIAERFGKSERTIYRWIEHIENSICE